MCSSRRMPSVSWEMLKKWTDRMSFITFLVEIRAVRFLTGLSLPACMHLIVIWMILLLFPAMRKLTSIFIATTFRICMHKVFCFPLRALLSFIFEYMRFSSKILPVMSIDTGISRMRCVTIRAPHCFEMKNIEICRILVRYFFIIIIYRRKLMQ